TVRTEEYYRLIDEAEKLTETVNKLLADDALQTFHDLQETQHLLTSIASEDSYTRGFRDGAGIMLDVLNG
ncbi:MAG: hypothetical protein IKP69_11760, partial [Oscillospiraceae bacterium]|nr:hypothetical protein [Oscillospiraceae bacterium]